MQPVALTRSPLLAQRNATLHLCRPHVNPARAWSSATAGPRGVEHRACELPISVRQHLDNLGVPSETFHEVQDAGEFSRNAEPALETLMALTSRQRVRTLLVGHPQLLCVPLGVWLDFLTAYGMSRQDFFSLLGSCPELFTRGSLFNAGNVMAYLQSLGLGPRDVVASILPRNAAVLLRDVTTGLAPAVDFLRLGLGLQRDDVRDFLCRCPGVLSRDAAADLAPRVELLCAAGFERGTACRLLFQDASLLTGDLESALHARVSFLTVDCGLSGEQAAEVLRRCPEAMSLSLPNLDRKWRFLTERMGCGREQVLEYPQFLSKNLLLQIGPRFAYTTERLGLHWRGSAASGGPAAAAAATPALQAAGGANAAAANAGGRGSSGSSNTGAVTSTSAMNSNNSYDAASSSSSSSGGDAGGGGGGCDRDAGQPSLGFTALFEGDDLRFLEWVWGAAAAASAGRWAGRGDGSGGRAGAFSDGDADAEWGLEAGGGPGPGPGPGPGEVRDAEWLLADFARFRSGWLEREGARWTGVRSVGGGMTGSW
ncbi:hypothetical protein PLESTB_000769600 [Pleodorina starrii]|uniref:Uncharacterized protein n=1 Tax=Pleodorina starrii TaxID=330485 RepID=A0A9W6BKV7_9CHLO|nr:hypothetical protein PLESTM_000435700 [Pleodorina starrii]GLC53620.1 hypothetical protein PLESTB_000769600 [Pleodorina starrii]GLC65686.1 hypothetical protein PLESTF_000328900 [Pleodorina starrii]